MIALLLVVLAFAYAATGLFVMIGIANALAWTGPGWTFAAAWLVWPIVAPLALVSEVWFAWRESRMRHRPTAPRVGATEQGEGTDNE